MPFIEAQKNIPTSIFYGYHDSQTLAAKIQDMSRFIKRKGYMLVNIDFASFDTTISPELRVNAGIIFGKCFKTALAKLINNQSVL